MGHSSSSLHVLVLYNNDFLGISPDSPNFAAVADVVHMAEGVAAALAARGHRAELRGVDAGGIAGLVEAASASRPDLVFNLCESLRGDNRHEVVVPSLLELLGIPYTGSGPLAMGLSLNKDRAKDMLRGRGVPTPEAVAVTSGDGGDVDLPFPLIVKPTREDASVGITMASVVHDRTQLARAVRAVLEGYSQPALVERYVEGRELYVSLLGNAPPRALPFHEIDFSTLPVDLPRIVSYAGKWDVGSPEFDGTRPTRCLLDEDVRERVERAARAAFDALGLADYGRVDVRLAADGTPYVIDVNPNCDLSSNAGFARAASYGGIDYGSLIERVCTAALERHAAEDAARTRRAPEARALPLLDAAARPFGAVAGEGPAAS